MTTFTKNILALIIGCIFVGIIIGFVLGVKFTFNIGSKPVSVKTPDASITLGTLDNQSELTIWTQEGSDTYVPIKMEADDIIYQIKGSDAVPNGLYPSYYNVNGLELNGNPVIAITGFMPESDGE